MVFPTIHLWGHWSKQQPDSEDSDFAGSSEVKGQVSVNVSRWISDLRTVTADRLVERSTPMPEPFIYWINKSTVFLSANLDFKSIFRYWNVHTWSCEGQMYFYCLKMCENGSRETWFHEDTLGALYCSSIFDQDDARKWFPLKHEKSAVCVCKCANVQGMCVGVCVSIRQVCIPQG